MRRRIGSDLEHMGVLPLELREGPRAWPLVYVFPWPPQMFWLG